MNPRRPTSVAAMLPGRRALLLRPAAGNGLATRVARHWPCILLAALLLTGSLGGGRSLENVAAAEAEAGEGTPTPQPTATKKRSPKAASPRVFSDVTRTSVFGVEGQGSTFVYLFDRSGSMSEFQGRPLAAAKSELLQSLQSLRATNQFQIIFYNHEQASFNPYHPQPPRLMFGDDRTKEQAEQFVRQIKAGGGTRHLEPLRLALKLAPDVVFFLTDAAEPELTAQQLEELARLNQGTVVHTIEFGVGPSAGRDNFMRKLARQSGGRYVYVDVTQLPNR